MNWRWLKAFPKFALVVILIVGSSIAFYGWWWLHSFKKALFGGRPGHVEDVGPKIAKIEAKRGRLLLVDNDLYDFDTGELIFGPWLNGSMPVKLFWEIETQTVLAQYDKAFVRHSLAGKQVAALSRNFPFVISSDYKWALYSQDKDVWRANIDWEQLKLVEEKKLTSVQSFNDNFFAPNVMLGTDKTLVVRVVKDILRVNLETGDVHPMKFSLLDIGKRRSPDSKSVVGLQNGEFYCYDVDTDAVKSIKVGRGAINDYQWLDSDRCLAIASMKSVVLYDRAKHTLTEVAALPFPCFKIGVASPDGRFIFCEGRGNGVLVDVTGKTAKQVTGGAGVCWVSKDTFAFSREIADSDLRGTWFQTVGEEARRVSPEPFIVTRTGPMLLAMDEGTLVFATRNGISRTKKDGAEVVELVKLPHAPERIVAPEVREE